MIRLAILGFWHVHADDYAREAQEHPRTEIVAAWDEDPQRGEVPWRQVPHEPRGAPREAGC
jgi:predicted dehydrogenase